MTFALTNAWSHGTWVTPSHAHLALFGTFGMLGLAAAYYAIPLVRGIERFDQRLGKLGFWLLFAGMLGMSLAFALGGTVQVHVYRTLGLDWFGGDVYTAMMPYQILVPVFGFVFAIGAIVVVYDLYTLAARAAAGAPSTPASAAATTPGGAEVRAAAHAPAGTVRAARAASGWARELGGFEAGTWLLAMWIFGAIITLGLLAFNLPSVRAGQSYLPQMLAFIGYPGLLATTLLFVWRFLASMEARSGMAPAGEEVPSAAELAAGGFVALGPLSAGRSEEAAKPGAAAPA
ncbi:MAG: cbb3-type cytochrome c oxidase subunit I, partial [Burkholderiaceae bacterium]|nr:cbb3-type cytochrome c oxidase subunit I [Burkholderiaceae bacterium]